MPYFISFATAEQSETISFLRNALAKIQKSTYLFIIFLIFLSFLITSNDPFQQVANVFHHINFKCSFLLLQTHGYYVNGFHREILPTFEIKELIATASI